MKNHLQEGINPFMIAPMLGYTTRHYRYFMRLISQKITLFTEMQTTAALLNYADSDRFMGFHPAEQPLIIQLGGSDPLDLAVAAKMAQRYGYAEVNLNVGCPSHRVKSGFFGAVLMKHIQQLAACVAAIKAAVTIPVSIKMRTGVDNYESYDYLANLVEKISAVGCKRFIIHARKAWLNGLSPKQNREIPPLNYKWVYRIKHDFPELAIIINGGIKNLAQAEEHLRHVDGVMMGRAALRTPYMFRALDFPGYAQDRASVHDRIYIAQKYSCYAHTVFMQGVNLSRVLQPLFGLFYGLTGAKQWRYQLTQAIQANTAPMIFLKKALSTISTLHA